MRTRFALSIAFITLMAMAGGLSVSAAPSVCTPTSFFRDGINMPTVKIKPSGKVFGNLDATGCNIGSTTTTARAKSRMPTFMA